MNKDDMQIRSCKGYWKYCNGNCSKCAENRITITDKTQMIVIKMTRGNYQKESMPMGKEEQQKQILKWLHNTYTGAKAFDDLDTMTRLARAIEAFELPVSSDVVIACKESDKPTDEKKKVIKGLEECIGNGNCTKCQYRKEIPVVSCKKLIADALELIKG